MGHEEGFSEDVGRERSVDGREHVVPDTGVRRDFERDITTGIGAEVARATPNPKSDFLHELETPDFYEGSTTLRDRTKYYKDNFLGTNRAFLERSWSRFQKDLPKVKKIFDEEHVPYDLMFLCFAESGWKADAHSNQDAVGYWQFLADTGRAYGLKINGSVDERKDVEKSTRAACRYLKTLYRYTYTARGGKAPANPDYKDSKRWFWAMTAYFGGEGNVFGVGKAGGGYYEQYNGNPDEFARLCGAKNTKQYAARIIGMGRAFRALSGASELPVAPEGPSENKSPADILYDQYAENTPQSVEHRLAHLDHALATYTAEGRAGMHSDRYTAGARKAILSEVERVKKLTKSKADFMFDEYMDAKPKTSQERMKKLEEISTQYSHEAQARPKDGDFIEHVNDMVSKIEDMVDAEKKILNPKEGYPKHVNGYVINKNERGIYVTLKDGRAVSLVNYKIKGKDYVDKIAAWLSPSRDVSHAKKLILALNPSLQRNPNLMYRGEDLLVPADVYVVKKGDSMFNLAMRFYPKFKPWTEAVNRLKWINGKTDNGLRVGEALIVPAKNLFERR